MPSRLKNLAPYAVLLLILAIAYLPVSTFYFGMKNDAFSDNFPNKFFLTEVIHSGRVPLWNPYINFGFPIYADMGFAFYNPITWLFALIGYNAYTLTAEVLFYIYFGGIFMFRLCRFFKFDGKTSLVIAAMYMCSGFYTGSLQYINFLTAAAFLPLVIQTLLQLLHNPCFKTSFFFALACYFVFAGGHPAIPIAMAYFLPVLVLLLFIFLPEHRANSGKIFGFLGVSAALMLLFYLPAIYSYTSILPVYARGVAASQDLSTQAGFSFLSYQSFLFPFSTATTSNIFNTDVAMRNGYFGIGGFICVVLSIKSKQPYVKVFLVAALLMLLLSAGGSIKALLFFRLPLLQYVRYNGEYRVFSILCFCIIGGYGLQQLMAAEKAFTNRFKKSLVVILLICLAVFIPAAAKGINVVGMVNLLKQPLPLAQKIKILLGGPPEWFLLISATITMLVSLTSLLALKRHKLKLFAVLIIADITINSIIYLPVTGVGQVPLKNIQAVYNTSPNGIIVPPLVPVNKIDTLDAKTTGLVGDITYYNKLIGTTKLCDYPSYFTSTGQYFNKKALVHEVSKKPYLFVKDSNNKSAVIAVQKFRPGVVEIQVSSPQDDTLVLLQNNYRFWHAVVNGEKGDVATAFTTFMQVKINKGTNDVLFYYEDRPFGICVLVSITVFIICISVITRQRLTYK